jgi:hypothetical protein
LECKFHDHFYSPENEVKLSDMTSVRQGHDESVSDYIRRFRDTKNWCFNLMISERDMTDLVFNGLRSYLREKLVVILSLLFLNFNKRLRHKKARVKKIKIILSILTAMLTISIVIPIALAMSPTIFMLQNFAGLSRLNLILVTLSSRFTKNGKKKLSLHLM